MIGALVKSTTTTEKRPNRMLKSLYASCSNISIQLIPVSPENVQYVCVHLSCMLKFDFNSNPNHSQGECRRKVKKYKLNGARKVQGLLKTVQDESQTSELLSANPQKSLISILHHPLKPTFVL